MSKAALARKGSLLVMSSVRLLVIGSALLFAAGCGREKRAEETRQPKSQPEAAAVTANVVPPEDRDTTITLNPCKGEQPGNVLGVSEQLEAPLKVKAFVKKLSETDPKVRACAARQLGYLKADARDALPHLIRLTRDEEDLGVRVNVSDALWEIGPATKTESETPELIELSRNEDVYIRLYAAFALGYHEPSHPGRKEVVGALMYAAKDEDRAVRWMALHGLTRLGPLASDAVPLLIEILQDEKDPLRLHAARALGRIGPEAAEAVPVLLKTLNGAKDHGLYISVAMALGQIGPVILPALEQELKAGNTLRTLDVLSHLGPSGAPLVIKALRAPDKQARRKALGILARLGPAAEPAVPLLIKALKDPDKEIRADAAIAFKNIGAGAHPAIPALTAALGDKEEFVQCSAAEALGAMGEAARSAVPELLRLMRLAAEGEVGWRQRCAAEALMAMGPETKALVPAEVVKEVEEWNARVLSTVRPIEQDETKPKPKEEKRPEQTF